MLPYLFYPLLAATLLFLAAIGFFVYATQKYVRTKLARNLFIVASVIFALAVVLCVFFHLRYRASLEDGDIFFINSIYFYPLIASVVAVMLSVGFYIYSKANNRFLTPAKWSLGGVVLASLITIFVCIGVYYKREISPYEYYDAMSPTWLYVGAAGIAVILSILCVFFGRNSKKSFDSKSVSYGAVCIAISFALSYITLWKMPQGGSITLVSLLPLMLYSQMFGVRKGVFIGLIYGILQAIQDPWILHPAQFLLDYPLAFACIGLAAVFTQNGIKDTKGIVLFALGSVLAVTLRYASHVISGIFAFAMYAVDTGYSAVPWGFLYNTFSFADMAIALVVGVAMLTNSSFRKMLNKVTASTLPDLSKTLITAENAAEKANEDAPSVDEQDNR